MSLFKPILQIDGQKRRNRESSLFSVPSNVLPHESSAVSVLVRRHHVGMVGVGEVVSSGHDTTVAEPEGATLIVAAAGRLVSAAEGGPRMVAGTGEALFFSPNRRQTRVTPPGRGPFLGIPIIVPRSELRAAAARLGASSRAAAGMEEFSLRLAAGGTGAAGPLISIALGLRDAVAARDRRLLGPKGPASWTALMTEKMVEMLSEAGVLSLRPATDGRAAAFHVRRAREYIESNFADIVTVAEVAAVCGISVRTLEMSFREVWSQTPHHALVSVRLASARRSLLAGGHDTVTGAALAAGFVHLGRFARLYGERYDERPSQTLARVLA